MFGNAAASLTRRRNTREVEALQVRMRRQVSGSEIELHRIARLRDGWAGRGQTEVFEHLLDRPAVGPDQGGGGSIEMTERSLSDL